MAMAPNAPNALPLMGGDLVVEESAPAGTGGTSLLSGLRDAGPLATAGLVANAANVVVTVLMARLLSTRGYGALAQLTSLFLIISMPGTAVIVGVVRRIADWKGAGSAARTWRWARRLHAQATAALIVFAVLVFAARGWIAHLLGLPAPFGVWAILVAGAVWILLSLDRGLLQAHRSYRTLSANLLVEGGARTLFVILLVVAGFGVAGAAWGVLIAEVIAAVHARVVADRVWSGEERRQTTAGGGVATRPEHPAVSTRAARAGRRWLSAFRPDADASADRRARRVLLLDVGAALLAMALLALLQNVDVIVLGREAPHQSGSYAAISVASKALVFGAVALGGYLLPEAAIHWRQGGHALRQLAVTLLVLAIPVAGLLVVSLAFPHLLLTVVFGPRYVGAQSAFFLLVLAMTCLSTTVVLTMYLLAAGQRWVGAVLLAGAAAATVAVALAHGAPRATAGADLGVQAVLVVVTGVAFARLHHRRITSAGTAG